MRLPWAFLLVATWALGQSRYTVADELASGPGSPRVVVLRDSVAEVEAAIAPSEGGELASYRVKFRGEWVELLYRARDYPNGTAFAGKAPLLWPAVGGQFPLGTIPAAACTDGTYPLGGKTYPMPCHGFARHLPWTEVKRAAEPGSARVTVRLRDSERTRTMYPFAFELDATYTLSAGQLSIEYTVSSGRDNAEPMIFSIGNHIAFRVPFLSGTNPAEMTFETPSMAQLLRDSHGLVSGKQRPRSFGEPTKLGDFDSLVALPLAGYRGTPYMRLVDPQGISLRMTQTASSTAAEPLVRFNVYGGPKVGYFSPEPWFGIQNGMNLGQGLVKLSAGAVWKWRIDLQTGLTKPVSPERRAPPRP